MPRKTTKLKLPTKAKLREHGVCSPNGLSKFGEGNVFLSYRDHKVYVVGLTHQTNPDAPWYDHGCKGFLGKLKDGLCLQKAQEWAGERYGIAEWVRDPFGGWQDRRVIERAIEKLKGEA